MRPLIFLMLLAFAMARRRLRPLQDRGRHKAALGKAALPPSVRLPPKPAALPSQTLAAAVAHLAQKQLGHPAVIEPAASFWLGPSAWTAGPAELSTAESAYVGKVIILTGDKGRMPGVVWLGFPTAKGKLYVLELQRHRGPSAPPGPRQFGVSDAGNNAVGGGTAQVEKGHLVFSFLAPGGKVAVRFGPAADDNTAMYFWGCGVHAVAP